MGVGIENLSVYPCTLRVDIKDMCEARGWDTANFIDKFYCKQRSVVGPYEDVVTMAVNAAKPLVGGRERARVGLLIVATESAVDQEKPVSTWAHRFLGLRTNCRNFEVKHACYGGTAAMRMAEAWVAHEGNDAMALVITSDHALIGIGEPQEPVLGAGAAAMLISHTPDFAEFDGPAGVYANEVADIFRPAPGVETGDAQESLMSYLDGCEESFQAYEQAAGRDVDFAKEFAAYAYHVPFGGLAERAHRRLCRARLSMSRQDALDHYNQFSRPSIHYNRQMGGVYGATTFVSMLGLATQMDALSTGDRVGVYAYGSGSCAEYYAIRVGSRARAVAEDAALDDALGERMSLDVPTYEACERGLHATLCAENFEPNVDLVPGLYESHYQGRGRLVLRGVSEYRRHYAWS